MVRGLLTKVLVVAALVAAVIVPTASATSSAGAKVSVLPLPKSALGAAAKSLALSGGGPVPNTVAAADSFTGSTKGFTKMGRITGYALDYGYGPSGGSGVTEIYTQVDQYKTAAGAKKGLAFWKKDDPRIAELNKGPLTVTSKTHKVPPIGSARFAYLVSFSAPNIVPVWKVDEQFTDGRYELDVTVWAGSAGAATTLAPKLAKKLDARLRQALAGKLHAKPVKLPTPRPAGQAPGGPDLSALALKLSDFNGAAMFRRHGYVQDSLALSTYDALFQPAGPFSIFDQEIFWYPTANEAAFNADWYQADFLVSGGSAVDLSGVGDGAQGAIDNESGGSFAQIVFSSGQLMEALVGISPTAIQTSDVQNLAQKAAGYINAAGLGS